MYSVVRLCPLLHGHVRGNLPCNDLESNILDANLAEDLTLGRRGTIRLVCPWANYAPDPQGYV